MLLIFFLIILFLLLIWFIGVLVVNDFSVASISTKHFKNILLIFPHPDDELLTAGGFIHSLVKKGKIVTLCILTKGEKGTKNATLELSLKGIRSKEAKKVSKILGVTKLIHEDFGDGELIHKKAKVTRYIDSLLNSTKPDLVLTYDLSGLYGHPDHIAVSEIITSLIKLKQSKVQLWYATFPKKVLSKIKLPTHMAIDDNFKAKQSRPDLKVFVGFDVLPKIRSLYAYKSQFMSYRSSIPFSFIPLWFFYSLQTFEYYKRVD